MTDWDKLVPPTVVFTMPDTQIWKDDVDKTFEKFWEQTPKLTGIDIGTGEKVILTKFENGVITHTDITKVYQNKVPTHDPYTNPDAHIYYQCNCGAVLDPGTKSFAQLNNAASAAGWKVRFGVEYYVPYCVECGEGVE